MRGGERGTKRERGTRNGLVGVAEEAERRRDHLVARELREGGQSAQLVGNTHVGKGRKAKVEEVGSREGGGRCAASRLGWNRLQGVARGLHQG